MGKITHIDAWRKVLGSGEFIPRREAVARLKELGVPESTAYDEITRLSRRGKSDRPRMEIKGDSIRLLDDKRAELERYRDEADKCSRIVREAYALDTEGTREPPMNDQKRRFYIERLRDLIKKGLSGEAIARTLIDSLKSDHSKGDKVELARMLSHLASNARDNGDGMSRTVIKGALHETEGSDRKGLMDIIIDQSEHVEVRCTLIAMLQRLEDWEVLKVIERLGEYQGDPHSDKILGQLDVLADECHKQNAIAVREYLEEKLDHQEEGVRLRAKRLLMHVLK